MYVHIYTYINTTTNVPRRTDLLSVLPPGFSFSTIHIADQVGASLLPAVGSDWSEIQIDVCCAFPSN
jgi:hypothetical protein